MSRALDLVARLKRQVEAGDLGAQSSLTPGVKQSIASRDEEGLARFTWDRETARLAKWLESWTPPAAPFVFRADDGKPVVTVEEPTLFKQALMFDTLSGPAGPRSHSGGLQADLVRLWEIYG